MFDFRSDNVAGIDPIILNALIEGNSGTATAYGQDEWTAQLNTRVEEVFDHEASTFVVSTGTAANAIGLSLLATPTSSIVCHQGAHIENKESNAPEFYTHGAKLLPVPGQGRIHGDVLQSYLQALKDDSAFANPAVLSLTQATDYGCVYSTADLQELRAVADAHALSIHMDGARFANAVVALGCHPADITWRAGVKVLSFGASKNGTLNAEALIVFDRGLATNMRHVLRRSGQLTSKSRFGAIQLLTYLEDDHWLALAGKSNRAAAALAAALCRLPDAALTYPVQSNQIFIRLTDSSVAALQQCGFLFKRWGQDSYRFVCRNDISDAELADATSAIDRISQSPRGTSQKFES